MSRPNEYYFKEGCFIEEWHNTPDDPAMSVAHVRVELSKTTNLHALSDTVERYVILQGEGIVSVAEKDWWVTSGDVVVIPVGVSQKIQNAGEEDLLFLAICTPRFDVKNYQERPHPEIT